MFDVFMFVVVERIHNKMKGGPLCMLGEVPPWKIKGASSSSFFYTCAFLIRHVLCVISVGEGLTVVSGGVKSEGLP